MKIVKNAEILSEREKAILIKSGKKIWIPKAAIIDRQKTGDKYSIVVDNWFAGNEFFEDVKLHELLNEKPPPDLKWVTGIEENEYPADLVKIQKQAIDHALGIKRALIWLWTGCGKTKIGIELGNVLYKHGKIKRLYWITPQFDRAQEQLNSQFKRWLNAGIEIKIVSINWFSYHIDNGIGANDCVIIDEAHRVKNGIIENSLVPSCKLANNIRISIASAGYAYALTADSCTNGVLDLFGIFFCLDRKIVIDEGKKAKHYLVMKGDRIKGVKSMLSFLQRISPYTFHRFRYDYDNRKAIEKQVIIRMNTDEQQRMNALYARINKFHSKRESLVDDYVLMVRCAYQAGGNALKKKELQKIITQIPKDDQIIVFGFTVDGPSSDIALMRESLIDSGNTFIELHGQRTDDENALAVHLFRQGKFRVLAASYGCGSELLDFPNANHVILFGHSLNPIHRRQGIGRIDRLVQKKQCHVYNMYIENSVEGYVNSLYDRKIDLSNDISQYMKLDHKTLNNEPSER